MRTVLLFFALALGVQIANAQAQTSHPAPAHAPAASKKCVALGGGCVDPGGKPCCSGQCAPVGFTGYVFPPCAKGNGNSCVCKLWNPFH